MSDERAIPASIAHAGTAPAGCALTSRKLDDECGCPEEMWDTPWGELQMHLSAGKASNACLDNGDEGERHIDLTVATVDEARAAIFAWAAHPTETGALSSTAVADGNGLQGHLDAIKQAARYVAIGDGYFDLYDSAAEAVDAAVDRLAASLAMSKPPVNEDERQAVVSYLRRQSDIGANRGNEADKGTTKRAAYGGGSLALSRAADSIQAGEHQTNDNATPKPPVDAGAMRLDFDKVSGKISRILADDPVCNGRVSTRSIARIAALVVQAETHAIRNLTDDGGAK